MRLLTGSLCFALAACNGAAPGDAPQADAAARLVQAAIESGQAPGLDYACDIWEPEYDGPMLESQHERAAYGTLSVMDGRYRLTLADGQSREGTLAVEEGAALRWDGDLGLIDDAPRRVTGARLTAYDTTANLVFDFEPPTDGPVPHRQVICRAAFEPGA